MMLDSSDAVRIGYRGAGRVVGDIKGIDGRAFLRADAGQNNVDAFLPEHSQQIVKKSNPVGRLDLDQRVNRVRFVVDCDCGWKFELVQAVIMNFASGLLQQWPKLESFNFQ